MPTPSASPTSADDARAPPGRRRARARSTSAPVIARPPASARPSADSGRSRATPRASRASAVPDASASRQPRFGQPPVARRPVEVDRPCARARPPRPSRRGTSSPSTTIPPPMPVPSVSMHRVRRAARGAAAVLGEHRAVRVVVDDHRQAERARPSGRGTGTSASGRCTVATATPGRWSISDGIPKPTPRHLGAGRAARPPRPPRPRVEQRPRGPPPRASAVGAVVDVAGPRRPTPASSFVPPRSTPITQPGGHDRHPTRLDDGRSSRTPADPPAVHERYRARAAAAGAARRRDAAATRRRAAPRARPADGSAARRRVDAPAASSSGCALGVARLDRADRRRARS